MHVSKYKENAYMCIDALRHRLQVPFRLVEDATHDASSAQKHAAFVPKRNARRIS